MPLIDDAARSLNTVGLATWFGGSLMGVVAVPPRGDDGTDHSAENTTWRRWTPVQAAGIAAYLVGATELGVANSSRLGRQRGVAAVSVAKVALTAAALGATVAASRLGRRLHGLDTTGATPVTPIGAAGAHTDARADSSARDRTERDRIERRLRAAQVAVPVLTGAILIADARLGEQQRPRNILADSITQAVPDRLRGLAGEVRDLTDHLPSIPGHLPSIPERITSLPESAGSFGERVGITRSS